MASNKQCSNDNEDVARPATGVDFHEQLQLVQAHPHNQTPRETRLTRYRSHCEYSSYSPHQQRHQYRNDQESISRVLPGTASMEYYTREHYLQTATGRPNIKSSMRSLPLPQNKHRSNPHIQTSQRLKYSDVGVDEKVPHRQTSASWNSDRKKQRHSLSYMNDNDTIQYRCEETLYHPNRQVAPRYDRARNLAVKSSSVPALLSARSYSSFPGHHDKLQHYQQQPSQQQIVQAMLVPEEIDDEDKDTDDSIDATIHAMDETNIHPLPDDEENEFIIREIRNMMQRHMDSNGRRQRCGLLVAAIVFVIVVVTVGTVLILRISSNKPYYSKNKSSDIRTRNNNTESSFRPGSTLELGSKTNRRPVAKCKTDTLTIFAGSKCSISKIEPNVVDDGSYDPDDDTLRMSIIPSGPYKVGQHTLSLLVQDSFGHKDLCEAQVLIRNDVEAWRTFQNHAYRYNFCKMSWNDAITLSNATTQCQSKAHLVTLTSPQEWDFVRKIRPSKPFWIGGWRTEKSENGSTASTSHNGWTWINQEGPVKDGIVDWEFGIPYNPKRICMQRIASPRLFIRDGACSREMGFLEEIDVTSTVIVDGCNSGVVDRFHDVNDCSLLIGPAIETTCGARRSSNPGFDDCLDTLLTGFVKSGSIGQHEKLAIQYCGDKRQKVLGDIHIDTALPVANTRPVAKCVDTITMSVGSSCLQRAYIKNASVFDAGSVDADGDNITLTLLSNGPYNVGVNRVTMTVYDSRGASDSCESTLIVTDDASLSSGWRRFGNSVYRHRSCPVSWSDARGLASISSYCGRRGQLVVMKSLGENEFVNDIFKRPAWIGGYQSGQGSRAGEWTWLVNNDDNMTRESDNDGLEFDDDLFAARSNPGKGFDCLVQIKKGTWKNETCQNRLAFVEKIDLPVLGSVKMNGCDTGVMDIPFPSLPSSPSTSPSFFSYGNNNEDPALCMGQIQYGIERCQQASTQGSGQQDVAEQHFRCIDLFLSDMVEKKLISVVDKALMLNCGQDNKPPIALCKKVVELETDSACGYASLEAGIIDDGTFDLNGDTIVLDTIPSGGLMLPVGVHQVRLVARTLSSAVVPNSIEQKQQQDSCMTTVIVTSTVKKSSSTLMDWKVHDNHAYRFNECGVDYGNATVLASRKSLCGVSSHLVTIQSQEEAEFLKVSVVNGTGSKFHIGIEMESASEGVPIDDSNSTHTSPCAALSGLSDAQHGENQRDHGETEEDCHDEAVQKRGYIEEVDLDVNITIRGCNTGIRDIIDLEQCSGVMTQKIEMMCTDKDNEDVCVSGLLFDFVQEGLITEEQMEMSRLVCTDLQEPPIARCKPNVVIWANPGCLGVGAVLVSDIIDNDSFDPDGKSNEKKKNELDYKLEPEGPLSPGSHQIAMTVTDTITLKSSSCTSNVVVRVDEKSVMSDWVIFNNNDNYGIQNNTNDNDSIIRNKNHSKIYRFGFCEMNWQSANWVAESVSKCGQHGHLATILSSEERNFIRTMGVGQVWVGARQEDEFPEPAGGWRWVNGDGLVPLPKRFSDGGDGNGADGPGFQNWVANAPNNKNNEEHCMAMVSQGQQFKWNDFDCDRNLGFLMQVDLGKTLVIDGCDSGVSDVLMDVGSCSYLIQDRLSQCMKTMEDTPSELPLPNEGKRSRMNDDCGTRVLQSLERDGILSGGETRLISACF